MGQRERPKYRPDKDGNQAAGAVGGYSTHHGWHEALDCAGGCGGLSDGDMLTRSANGLYSSGGGARMNTKKENARSAAATAEQAKAGIDFAGLDSHHDCTPVTAENQAALARGGLIDLIPIGAANAITKAQLQKITGLKDRVVRLLIHQARKEGKQILTNMETGGYYFPESPQETVYFIQSMRHRASEVQAVADAVERSLMDEVGQEKIGGW